MKIGIANFYTPSFGHIRAVTIENHKEYARRHGYEYVCQERDVQYAKVFYDRLRWYCELLRSGKFDWLQVVDADILFTNFNIEIESITDNAFHAVLCRDALMIVAGDMVLRCTPQCIEWLSAVIALEPFYQPPARNEQFAMEHLMPRFDDIIKIVPQKQMSTYDYSLYRNLGGNYVKGLDAGGQCGEWERGDFKFHCPAVMDRKAEILKARLKLVIT